MLTEADSEHFVATCEECGDPSFPVDGSRMIAVLRLMRSSWRVRTEGAVTRTWCPMCHPASSLPAIDLSGSRSRSR